jgi:hypothetical protein
MDELKSTMQELGPILSGAAHYKEVIAAIPGIITAVGASTSVLISYIGGEWPRRSMLRTLISQKAVLDVLEQIARLDVEQRKPGSALAGIKPARILKYATETIYDRLSKDITENFDYDNIRSPIYRFNLLKTPIPKSLTLWILTITYYSAIVLFIFALILYVVLWGDVIASPKGLSGSSKGGPILGLIISWVLIAVGGFVVRKRIFELRDRHEEGLKRFGPEAPAAKSAERQPPPPPVR